MPPKTPPPRSHECNGFAATAPQALHRSPHRDPGHRTPTANTAATMLLHVTVALVLAEVLSPQRASRLTAPPHDEGSGVTVDPGRLTPEEQPSMCWLCGPHCWIRCSWSVYYPRFVNHSAHVEVVSTQFGASQPALNIGPDDTLIVQGDGLFVSVTGGRNWTKCDPDAYYSWRCGAHGSAAALGRRLGARARSGMRSGVGWLSDGSILVTGSPGTFPSKQIVFRGTAPTVRRSSVVVSSSPSRSASRRRRHGAAASHQSDHSGRCPTSRCRWAIHHALQTDSARGRFTRHRW
eukprot:COSAG04_NODE_2484_length_4035_cov_5.573425_4_plen_292_part_00